MDKRKGLIAAYKKSGPLGRFLFVCSIIGIIGVLLTIIFFAWQQKKPAYKIDEAELADTTVLQEAIIIDLAKYSAEEMTLEHKGELFKILGGDVNKLKEFDFAINDLIRRDILRKVKIGQRTAKHEGLFEDAKVVNNIMLTDKGKKLAEDIEYCRAHLELNLIRPIEK